MKDHGDPGEARIKESVAEVPKCCGYNAQRETVKSSRRRLMAHSFRDKDVMLEASKNLFDNVYVAETCTVRKVCHAAQSSFVLVDFF